MRKVLLLVVLGCIPSLAAAAPVELHYFWAATCPDCQVMKAYLRTLATDYPDLRIIEHEVAYSASEFRLMVDLAAAYGVTEVATPVVVVGDLVSVGIGRAAELRIAEEVARCAADGCPSPLTRLHPVPTPAPDDEGPPPGSGSLGVVLVCGLVAVLLVAWILTR
ncbi:MAG TPA: thioredoxin family protein [Candidatus Bipolaricaulis sp.]|nr:thioredoxin family protein [Candidatus Bipolaricaulis sp.]HRS13749.1 thioredoxin family protein [Candidatus Bipolaricaulis sp.]HRU21543.1 thioredoxin family protein [Candidatus Bipolaricaulis sp.]